MTSSHIAGRLCHWFSALASALDARSAPRLACLLFGAILARGRRTVTSWIRGAGLGTEFRPCYTTVAAAGKRADGVAGRLVYEVVKPLLARLYVRKKDLGAIEAKHRPQFATKLELAVELVRWAKGWLDFVAAPVRVVADGAYAKAAFLKPLIGMGVVVVSRLRKDAALRGVPVARTGKRGRPRQYGAQRIVLAKRAGQKRGWTTGTFELYGKAVEKRYKTFEATWRPAGGVIRVVLVDEPKGWVAFFCTEPSATVADILGLVADRFSLETAFRDLKEIVGAGQQRVRHVRASVGSFHVCLWTFTMTEAWAWSRSEDELVAHRSASPWDDKPRRPSHADKRRAWRRELLAQDIEAVLLVGTEHARIHELAERLLDLAA